MKVFYRVFGAVLSTAMCFQVFAQYSSSSIENVEVVGQRTIPQLERQFRTQKFEFLELYNSLNEVAKFDVLCKWRKTLGSQIARKECEPRYLKDYRAMALLHSSRGTGVDFNQAMRLDDATITFLTEDTRQESYEHVAALVATHPELMNEFIKLLDLHDTIEERKASK